MPLLMMWRTDEHLGLVRSCVSHGQMQYTLLKSTQ